MHTSKGKISLMKRTISKIVGEPLHVRYKLDSHENATIAGKNCTIINYTDRGCDVTPFSEKCTSMKDILIVSVDTGFTSANGRN